MGHSPVINNFVAPIVSSMAVLASLLCAFFIVWGGLSYITSSGDPKKLQRAKRMLIRSLIGLVIVLSASAVSLILSHTYNAALSGSTNHLPVLSSIKTAPSGGGLVGVLIKAITGVLVDVIKAAAKPFILALNYFTKSTPLLTHNSSVTHLWLISTGIADGLLALVICLLGFHVMGGQHLGIGEVSLSTILPQLLFAFILINTSIYVLDGAIELSNVMIGAVRSSIGQTTPWHELLKVISGASGYSLAALIIFVIFIVFAAILLIYYIGRIVVLYLGAILAPIVVLLWLIPGFRDFAENALKAYLSTVFVLFVHVIILSLAGSLFAGVVSRGNNPDPVMSLLLGLATLIALIKTQGVLMQLNYASIGPRTARRLGGSFINGVSYLALSTRYVYAGAVNQIANSTNNKMPEVKSKTFQQPGKAKEIREQK